MDVFHQIEMEILQGLAVVIGSLIVWLIKKLLARLNIQLNADKLETLESAVNKVMTLGVTKSDDIIRAKGWDHIDSRSAVIQYALPALQNRFTETLTKVGVDLDKPEDRLRIATMMERMWPDVAARLSASPATPPPPVVPVAVVAAPPVA